MLALILCCALVGSVAAAYTVSIPYTPFNSATWTYYELGRNYTSVYAVVQNHLDITQEWVKVGFFDSNSGTANGTVLMFKVSGNVLEVYDVDNAVLGVSDAKIGEATWLPNSTIVTIGSDKLTVKDYSGEKVVTSYSFPHYVNYIGVCGGTSYVSDGFLQVDINQGISGVGAEISPIIPVVVLISVIGSALGYKKMKS